METTILYTLIIVLLLLAIKNRIDLKHYRKSVKRARFDYESKVSMWEDIKFKSEFWENDRNYILKTINALAKNIIRMDEQLYDNTQKSNIKSKVVNDEIMNKNKMTNLELLSLKSDGEKYRKERKNAVARIKRRIN